MHKHAIIHYLYPFAYSKLTTTIMIHDPKQTSCPLVYWERQKAKNKTKQLTHLFHCMQAASF